jgi:hypothetical protein
MHGRMEGVEQDDFESWDHNARELMPRLAAD